MTRQTRASTRAAKRIANQSLLRKGKAYPSADRSVESRSRDIQKKRTEQQIVDEKRRKRAKTCIGKLNQLGQLTDTSAVFMYYDAKRLEWDGTIHVPDGQSLPDNIGDKEKVKELQMRGPLVRRRGRMRKRQNQNDVTDGTGIRASMPIEHSRTPPEYNEDSEQELIIDDLDLLTTTDGFDTTSPIMPQLSCQQNMDANATEYPLLLPSSPHVANNLANDMYLHEPVEPPADWTLGDQDWTSDAFFTEFTTDMNLLNLSLSNENNSSPLSSMKETEHNQQASEHKLRILTEMQNALKKLSNLVF